MTISIDLELAWGFCDRPISDHLRLGIARQREAISRLLALFSAYDVRATWAIVAHLLMKACARQGELVHPEIPRPVSRSATQDWFFQHPTSADDPLWYGRDIVDAIRSTSPPQEIGSHSFCHLPFDERDTYRPAIQADIDLAKTVHTEAGLPFAVFVFPRNVVGFTDLLARAGIRVYRGRTPKWSDGYPGPLRRMLSFLDHLVPTAPPTVSPQRDGHGMIDLPDSMLLLARRGLRRLIPANLIIARCRAGVARAADRGEVFHLWFHPSNLVYEADTQFAVLEAVLRHAAGLRRDGLIRICPMGEIGGA